MAILAYHNVIPDRVAAVGDTSLHLPLSRFLRQLDALQRTHTFVDLPTAMKPADGRIRAIVTFDDAYRGAVNLALPELRQRGIPATVFVCPALLDEPGLWWDELGETGQLTPGNRDRAMYDMRGELQAVRKWAFRNRQPPRLPNEFGVASAAELVAQVGERITLGAHSWSHACLPALDVATLRRDLNQTLSWLDEFPAPSLRWLALPYGEGSEQVAAEAVRAGYQGILKICGGLAGPVPDITAVPRINVPAGISARGLLLRASGVHG